MANLADSAVTVLDSYTDGGISSKRHVVQFVDVVLTGQGGTTNKILASNFGLAKIEASDSARYSDNSVIPKISPSYDGTFLLIGDPATGIPADLTGITIRMRISGYR